MGQRQLHLRVCAFESQRLFSKHVEVRGEAPVPRAKVPLAESALHRPHVVDNDHQHTAAVGDGQWRVRRERKPQQRVRCCAHQQKLQPQLADSPPHLGLHLCRGEVVWAKDEAAAIGRVGTASGGIK
jgi:hypothetical protein